MDWLEYFPFPNSLNKINKTCCLNFNCSSVNVTVKLILHHIRHHSHKHSCCHYHTNNHHKNHLIYFCKINHINPKDPAVIPTVTKNPNSTRSLEPGGSDVNSTAKGIIEIQMKIHYYMLLLLRCSQKL